MTQDVEWTVKQKEQINRPIEMKWKRGINLLSLAKNLKSDRMYVLP